MNGPNRHPLALLALTVPVVFLLIACGDGDAGLSRTEVQEIVRRELVEAQASPQPEPGLTLADVEEAIRKAMADMPQPEPGLTRHDVEQIVRGVVASIPPKSDPAQYTKFFVDNAISRYETQGLDSTLAYYNREESIDGQWYVFIIDEHDILIAHPDPGRLALDLKGWVGIDANGYRFGPEMLSATEGGKWVSYVYRNPEEVGISPGDLSMVDLKNAWVVRHDGLLFGSGWYIDVDQFTQDIVAGVVDLFHSEGLEGLVESLSSDPGSLLGGVAESAVSYNSSATVEGEWSVFIADTTGSIVLHFNPAMIGTQVQDLLGTGASEIDEDGTWLTSEAMRIWAVRSSDWMFGAGWRKEGSGN